MVYSRLEELCQDAQKSPSSVAIELGYTKSAITRWRLSAAENDGMCSLNSSMLTKIASYFNVSTDYLLGITDQKNPRETNESVSEKLNPYKMLLLDEADGMTDKSLEQVIRMMRVIKGMQD